MNEQNFLFDGGKLIHNLRASFETDLLNGKYGQYGLHTIAKWLGHSVSVMLEHYGRIQQSDYDQIADACVQVKERNNQPMGQKEAHFVPFRSQSECLTLEHTDPTPPSKASLSASLYTAARGEFKVHRVESPLSPDVPHALENKEHEGNKRQEMESCVNRPNSQSGGHGSRTRNTFRCTSFPMRPLAIRIPSRELLLL